MNIKRPAPRPCESCPYRRDVPSGIWSVEEYAKLPLYDDYHNNPPAKVFLCHQDNGRLCGGWAGCHDMDETLALRVAVMVGMMTVEEQVATLYYESPIPLWSSGAEAAAHGLREIQNPNEEAVRIGQKIVRKRFPRRRR